MISFLKRYPLFLVIILFLSSCQRSYDANEIFKENSKAVVEIMTYDDKGNPFIQGTGFIVRKDGAIVTNYHVITKAKEIKVKVGDKVYTVEGLLHIDKENDIVILKAKAKELPIVRLGDIGKTRVGENVHVISRPGGRENTISDGILKRLRKIAPKTRILQITAPTSAGSSGGPVFNKHGDVIGIATLGFEWARNLTFAVPVNLIKDKISAKNITALMEAKIDDHKYWYIFENYDGDTSLLKDAIEACKETVRIKPDYAEAYYNLGNLYGKLGMPKEAIDAYKQAIKIKPDYAEAYHDLAVTYGRDLSMLREAIEAFRQAIRIKPDYVEAHINLGYAYGKSGMYKEAKKVYKKAIDLEPTNESTYVRLGNIFFKLGDHEKSIREYEKAFKLAKENINKEPQNAATYETASLCALFFGDFLTAERYAKVGISYDPEKYWIHCYLGHAYLLRGQKDEAIAKYKYFINHSTENPKDDIKGDFSMFKKRFPDKIYIIESVEDELEIK